MRERSPAVGRRDVAIVGMAGRFPGAPTLEAFWANLRDGVESVSFFSDEELLEAGVAPRLLADPRYVRAAAVLEDAELFDAAFFGYSPGAARLLDPQQRVFLECAWAALEHAGYAPDRCPAPVGVFAGQSISTYALPLLRDPDLARQAGEQQLVIANDKDFLATRVSYKLDLRGPSVTVQSACSTSLVAVHLACQSLLAGECDVCLAGGVCISVPQRAGYLHDEGGIGSPEGRVRAFDARADGAVQGNGCGVVVLRRLEDALQDGDHVEAVILASAVNNDGSAKLGYTAPSVPGQAAVIAEALAVAEVPPETVTYVEAHGTGTSLGDPMEVAALTRAYGPEERGTGRCALGSLKTNIGHLDAAAGVAGLIKVVLVLRHRQIPASLNFSKPNPQIDFAGGPFRVVTRLTDWVTPVGIPRRAGVSAFGVGGTNAHVVLEEAPAARANGVPPRPWHLFVLSARTAGALDRSVAGLAGHLADAAPDDIGDVSWTLQAGRSPLQHRAALVCRDARDAVDGLRPTGAERLVTGRARERPGPVTFLFPGFDAWRPGLAAELHDANTAFRAGVDECAELLGQPLGGRLRRHLLGGDDHGAEEAGPLLQQLCLFVLELALARLWTSWGVRPAAVLGHSLGEYAAASVAGALAEADALQLVAARGRLFERLPPGAMLAVPLAEADLRALLGDRLGVAAVNGPASCVVSGPVPAVAGLEAALAGRGVDTRRLPIGFAAHSAVIEDLGGDFRRLAASVSAWSPSVRWLSTLTGGWLEPGQAVAPDHWWRHLLEPVRFAAALDVVGAGEPGTLLELGPGQTLSTLARRQLGPAGDHRIVAVGCPPHEARSGLECVLAAAARLWVEGAELDWSTVQGGRRRRVALPTYPFERVRHWLEPGRGQEEEAMGGGEPAAAAVAEVLGGVLGIEAGAVPPETSFLELGADSLALIQVSRALQDRFGVSIGFRRLLGELSTLSALAAHVASVAPREALARGSAQPEPPAPPPGGTEIAAPAGIEDVLRRQLDVMAQQLEVLRGIPAGRAPAVPAPTPPPAAPPREERAVFMPYAPAGRGMTTGLTAVQQAHLKRLTARYTARTAGSKRLAQAHRTVLADNRASAGFQLLWKEMVYPIVGERSAGARFWDVDGNEYVDLSMDYGANLFGHAPEFIREAIERQAGRGWHIGPQSDLAGPAAELLCRLTGAERATFVNSGTEAVMSAVRLARAVTGRPAIAIFEGTYHGTFDGLLGRRAGGAAAAVPVAPGIPASLVQDLLVLPYDETALDAIEDAGPRLAAVLLEPVQSRRPDHQPRELLHRLRSLTERVGCALIFDEVITGFRVHQGGAQAWFDVRADLVTYGKAVGGGLPLGVVAGRARYLDAIDGGAWRYGDGSWPRADQTVFAGTFFKHPLVMAAALAALRRLELEGSGLQVLLNERTAGLAATLNARCAVEGFPVQVVHFGSLFRFEFPPSLPYADLFFYHLAERGIYIWEGRNCFLSTAHDDRDLQVVADAVLESLRELRAGGFLPPAPGSAADPAPEPPGAALEVPLTDAQELLWLQSHLAPAASVAYNESLALRLRGRLDATALRRAAHDVVERHGALRTAFPPGGRLQVVQPAAEAQVDEVHLSELDSAARAAEVDAWLSAQARTPFDLDAAPLIRLGLAHLGREEHLLVVTAHHLVFDGWSMEVLIRDLAGLYEARLTGRATRLPEAGRFSDFARRRRERQRGRDLAEDERYWSDRLAGYEGALVLPFGADTPAAEPHEGSVTRSGIEAGLYREIRRRSADLGCTPFVVLLAGFCALLHRLGATDDVVVGVPSAGRTDERDGHLIGYCMNLLPIRSRVGAATTFRELCLRLRDAVVEGIEHEHYSFARLLEGRPGLWRAVFNFERDAGNLSLPGLSLEPEPVANGAAKFPLGLNAIEVAGGLTLTWEHAAGGAGDEAIRGWADGYRTLLEAAAADPSLPVAWLPLLTPAERTRLAEWNATAEPGPPAGSVCELVAARARSRPGATAVHGNGRSLTYGELDARSGLLAGHLARLGLGPESVVGVCLERSPETVVAVLGVLRAGAAYLPLDPEYPPRRLQLMLEDAGVGAVLTAEGLRAVLPPTSVPVVRVDADWPAIAAGDPAPPLSGPAADRLAYVVYTSGSTGTPKGVMVTHGGLLNVISATVRDLEIAEDAGVAQLTTFSFDAATLEILCALGAGARLCIVPHDTLLDPLALTRHLREEHVEVAFISPSLLATLAPEELPELRTVMAGSEALSEDLAGRWARHRRFFNAYGATETTIYATRARCGTPAAGRPGPPPVGRPLANVRVHVLDRWLEGLPAGVHGELCIAGAGIARGYLRQPGLTAERFVPDPLSPAPGGRLYRSGDMGRRRLGGDLVFVGRNDRQVKVHGFRIELGEVESALARHPAVESAVAVVREDVPGDRGLVAYVEPRGAPGPDASELRAFLRATLAPFMVPAAIVAVPALPRNANGKLDLAALPAPAGVSARWAAAPEQPRTRLESLVAGAFREVLGLSQVGLHADFFELGGSSLSAARVVARLDGRLARRLTVRQVYLTPTVEGLARAAEADEAREPAEPGDWELLADVERLSDEDVEGLLGAYARGEEP